MSCAHYLRKCELVAPCCDKQYACRICHDDAEEHTLDRRSVKQIVCIQCHIKQEVARNCIECGILFGSYSCLICRLFDDRDKQQFHCVGCGICRVGGRDNFFHCAKCNICIATSIMDSHTCVENMSRRVCPVCLEDLHSSRKKVDIPSCSHMIHSECLVEMFQHGRMSCPTCNHSLVDMKNVWEHFDEAIANTPMPEIYRNYRVSVLCRDCHVTSKVVFHVIGLKCEGCGGYNTTRVGGDDPVPEDPTNQLQQMTVAQGMTNEETGGTGASEEEAEDGDSRDSWETIYTEEDETNIVSATDSDAVIVLLPGNDEALHGNDDDMPSDREELPSNNDELPSNDDETPSNDDETPSNDDETPSNVDETPSNRQGETESRTEQDIGAADDRP